MCRLVKSAYYVSKVDPEDVVRHGVRSDKQGGVFLQWNVWGGVVPAWVKAKEIAGWQ